MVATSKSKILIQRDLRTDRTGYSSLCVEVRTCGRVCGQSQEQSQLLAAWTSKKKSDNVHTHALSGQQQRAELVRRSLVPVSDIMKEWF